MYIESNFVNQNILTKFRWYTYIDRLCFFFLECFFASSLFVLGDLDLFFFFDFDLEDGDLDLCLVLRPLDRDLDLCLEVWLGDRDNRLRLSDENRDGGWNGLGDDLAMMVYLIKHRKLN